MSGATVEPVRVIGAFQTGRQYTSAGQRIAWTVLTSGHVSMYDIDRMVDYVLRVPLPVTDAGVLAAYDSVSHSNPNRADVPYNAADYAQAFDVRPALMKAARLVAPRGWASVEG